MNSIIDLVIWFFLTLAFTLWLTSCQTIKVTGTIRSGTETLARVEIEGVKELCAGIESPENCIISVFKGVNDQLKETVGRKK
jgi:hypothetical protein